ncbi:MAG: hypothetical protein IKV04_05005 [Alistipes sp.]|nr:hypothetical protein [Alistipes sp.]
MSIYCLIIDDDNNQVKSFDTEIKRVLRQDGIEVEQVFVWTKDPKYINESDETLNYAQILSDCQAILRDNHISVIACDYGIATNKDNFTGVDLLADIAESHAGIHKILYSGTIHKVLKDIKDRDDEQIETHLLKLQMIDDFNGGKGYAHKIIERLRNPEVKFQQNILHLLKSKYPELTFKSCYPNFVGKRLKDVADEIEKDTPRGRSFQKALLDQVISYLIKINEE